VATRNLSWTLSDMLFAGADFPLLISLCVAFQVFPGACPQFLRRVNLLISLCALVGTFSAHAFQFQVNRMDGAPGEHFRGNVQHGCFGAGEVLDKAAS